MKQEINIEKLINRFSDMAKRGTLLTGHNVTQDDLLSQIIGTIVKVYMENDDDFIYSLQRLTELKEERESTSDDTPVNHFGLNAIRKDGDKFTDRTGSTTSSSTDKTDMFSQSQGF